MTSKLLKYTDTPWLACSFISILMLLVLFAQLSAHDRDPSYFISIGDKYVMQPDDLPKNVYILQDSSGYDGQFYLQLALTPFRPQQINAGLNLSNGPYRHQRIVYPILVWLFSLGNPDLVPAMLVFVNYLALCALAWLGSRYAQLHGRHALWGSLFALFPGFLFTLTRDLTEILVIMFLLAGVLTFRQSHSNVPPTLLFTLAVLTKETALLAVVALGLALALTRQYSRWPVFGIPFGAYAIWQMALWARWGRVPALEGMHNIGVPGSGIMAFASSIDGYDYVHRVWLLEFGYVAVVALIALLVALRAPNHLLPYKMMWALYALLVISLTHHVWIEDLAFMRATAELHLFSMAIIVARADSHLFPPIAISTGAIWSLVFSTRLTW